MDRRPVKLILDVLLVLVGALLAVTTNYATSEDGDVPFPLRLLRTWSVPLLGLGVLALVAGQVWLHYLDRPVAVRRTWTSGQPPYPGLEAFTEADAAVFFGRDREVSELVGRLHPAVPGRAARCVTVVGPSGSGKSSLVRAGLLPALARRRRRWAVAEPFSPGTDPVGALRLRLDRLPDARPALVVVDQLEELLTLSGPEERTAFLTVLRTALREDPQLWVVATLRSDFLTGVLEGGLAELVRDTMAIGALGREELYEVIERPAEQAGLSFAPGVVARMVDDCGGGDALPLLAYTLQELYLRAGGSGGTVTHETYRALGGVPGALSERADRITAELGGQAPVLPALLRFVTVDRGEPTRRRVPRAELEPAQLEVADAFVAGRLLTGDGGTLDVAHEALFRRWPPLSQAVAARADELHRRTELERWAQDWEHAGRPDAYLLAGERLVLARQWMEGSARALGAAALVAEFVDRSARADRATLARTADAVALRVLESAERRPESAVAAGVAAAEECGLTPALAQALRTALGSSRLLGVHRGFRASVTDAAWSPDGRWLAASSGDGGLRAWPVADAGADLAAEPAVHLTGRDWIRSVAWSPDGSRIACGTREGAVAIWSTATWTPLASLRHGDAGHGVTGIAWAPDGSRLASVGSDRVLRVWDTGPAGTYAEVMALQGHARPVWAVAWSPDGRWIASAGEGTVVRIRAADTGETVRELREHQDTVEAVCWSPDGSRLASSSKDRTVRIWSTGTWTVDRRLDSMDGLNCLAWSPDGRRLAAGDQDRGVRVWELTGVPDGPAPDGPAAEAALWLTGHTDTLYAVSWSPDGTRLASASRDCVLAVWDAAERTGSLHGHEDSVWHAAWSPDGGQLASASQDGTVRLWEPRSGRQTDLLRPAAEVADVAWSPDGARVAAALRDGRALLWRPGPGGGSRTELRGHRDELSDIAWSPDGARVATASRDSTVRIWDAATGAVLHVLESGPRVRGHDDWLTGTAWSPDGRLLATSGTGWSVVVWDTDTGLARTVLTGHADHAWKVDWSPDGTRLVTGSRDRTLRLWDPALGVELAVMTGHEDRVQGVAWSPDGTRIASASRDRTVRLWDPRTASQLAVVGVGGDWVNSLDWHPDGSRLVTASRDRTVRIWDVSETDPDALLRRARSRLLHGLSAEERRAFLLPGEG
ncbi:NACHT and WD repeat domain-containing protein [Streptomyces sp. NPDC085524]|uniref:NACHT and WD repeat domain-containing protein n=1 Tax=Streptomyces sp. NPDC085524 TaxID=3365728 RepID=UPI0037CD5831